MPDHVTAELIDRVKNELKPARSGAFSGSIERSRARVVRANISLDFRDLEGGRALPMEW